MNSNLIFFSSIKKYAARENMAFFLLALALLGGVNLFIILRFFADYPISIAIYPAILLIFFVLLVEIYVRKNLFHDLKLKKDEAIHLSEERFSSLVDHIENYAICMLDSKGHITSWNSGGVRINGYKEDEVLGQHISLFYPFDDTENNKPNNLLQVAALEGHVEDIGWRVKKDGTLFWADVVISVIRNSDGQIKGFTEIVRDLTDIKNLTEKNQEKFKDLEGAVNKRTEDLEKTNAKLRSEIILRRKLEEELKFKAKNLAEIDQRKNEFLAVLGHELRNPLSSILSSVEFIKYIPSVSGEIKEIFATIERQTRNLERILKDLLDISRVMYGKIELRKTDIDLRNIVTNALSTARPLIEKGRHKISIELPDKEIVVNIDSVRIEQVLVNLLNNAAKFTPQGGKITVALAENRDSITLSVKDTGVGIEKKALSTLFTLFHQERESEAFFGGGLGVGLMLAKNLTRLHGGDIEAKSEGIGKGSEFIVTFPKESIRSGKHRLLNTPEKSHKIKILIIDDNSDAADSLRNILNRLGYNARSAYGGEEGLSEAEAFKPDIIFLDLGMPMPDGFEVAKHIKNNPKLSRIFLIALTGFSDEDNKRKISTAGFDNSLIKPASIDEIRKLINSYPTLAS